MWQGGLLLREDESELFCTIIENLERVLDFTGVKDIKCSGQMGDIKLLNFSGYLKYKDRHYCQK